MNRQNNKMTTGISALVLGKQGRHEDGRSGVIMQELTGYQLVQLADRAALAQRASDTIAQVIDLSLAERDRAQIALSGGSTPEATYHQLGREHLAPRAGPRKAGSMSSQM